MIAGLTPIQRFKWLMLFVWAGPAQLYVYEIAGLPVLVGLIALVIYVALVVVVWRVNAWMDEAGIHYRSLESLGRTRVIPMAEIARAEAAGRDGPLTLRVWLRSGLFVDIAPIRALFVGEKTVNTWVDAVNVAVSAGA